MRTARPNMRLFGRALWSPTPGVVTVQALFMQSPPSSFRRGSTSESRPQINPWGSPRTAALRLKGGTNCSGRYPPPLNRARIDARRWIRAPPEARLAEDGIHGWVKPTKCSISSGANWRTTSDRWRPSHRSEATSAAAPPSAA